MIGKKKKKLKKKKSLKGAFINPEFHIRGDVDY